MAETNTDARAELTSPAMIEFATRMYNAARHGDLAIFEQALPAGLPPNMTNDKGDSLLMLAAYHGHVAVAKLLLSHGADPNVLNDRGQSPLAGVIFKKENEIVELLLESGADPDLGRPSASEAAKMFKVDEDWAEKFTIARSRLSDQRKRNTAESTQHGPGGLKAASELM